MPSGLAPAVEREAQRVAGGAVEALGAVGVMAVEVFVLPDGHVWVNEVAPRPHNTGHVTIEACHTSQFENHVRAVLGWPLGDPSLRVPAACLVNALGHTTGPRRLIPTYCRPGRSTPRPSATMRTSSGLHLAIRVRSVSASRPFG